MAERTCATLGMGLALAVLPLSAAPLPPETEALIDQAVERSAPPLAAAIDLANRDVKSDRNLLVFLKVLKDYGFGAPVPRPPWADEPEHEDPDAPPKVLTEEEKKEKAREHEEMIEAARVNIGRYDLNNFQRIDLNGDTRTDAKEIAAALRGFLVSLLKDHFVDLDVNRDGKLSLREYVLSMPADGKIGEDGADWHQREHFEEDDKNNSGFIEMEERIAWAVESIHSRGLRCLLMFQLAGHDKNGDGRLDREEFAAISEGADAVYAKTFEEGESLEISNAYARLFWVSAEDLAAVAAAPPVKGKR